MDDAKRMGVDSGGRGCCPGCGVAVQVQRPRPAGPCCPWCQAPVTLENAGRRSSGLGFVGQEQLLWCTDCGAVLGFSAWKR